MTLDDLIKPNLMTLIGVGLVSAALPKLVPEMRPALKSAIQSGLVLFAESEEEAEAELIQSLVTATLGRIRDILAAPASAAERRHAVHHAVGHFKRQAEKRASRWATDTASRRRCYDRHVARLETALARHKTKAEPDDQTIIEDAFIALAEAH